MKIALALSGGGHRAACFHLGVLKYLAEHNLLENVTDVSSVSGGSILVAQVFHNSKKTMVENKEDSLLWPDSALFLTSTLAKCKSQIIHRSLENSFIKRMFLPKNWSKLGHRANLMASVIKRLWGIEEAVEALPSHPNWTINGTTNLSGCRWRVEHHSAKNSMGSKDLGFFDSSKFPIADAVAISAAYPGAIGPYRFNTGSQNVFLSDGGLYDNLALEAVFDLESQSINKDIKADFLIVSDAGKGIQHKHLAPVWRPLLRTIRLIDVINQQVRSLRLRTLLPFFDEVPKQGLYLSLGANHRDKSGLPKALADYSFLSVKEIERAKSIPTTLASLSEQDFELLLRHGYECALVQFGMLASKQGAMA